MTYILTERIERQDIRVPATKKEKRRSDSDRAFSFPLALALFLTLTNRAFFFQKEKKMRAKNLTLVIQKPLFKENRIIEPDLGGVN
jgi:hypothetical protein